jgi:HAE1 family hydrophobic/amphiphilic exporter-1
MQQNAGYVINPQVQQIIFSNLIFQQEISNKRKKILIRLAGKYKNVDELRNRIVTKRN